MYTLAIHIMVALIKFSFLLYEPHWKVEVKSEQWQGGPTRQKTYQNTDKYIRALWGSYMVYLYVYFAEEVVHLALKIGLSHFPCCR